ncbi:hypothetical protein O5O45_09985 [Hahella aquimaris]|uniref:hypothetical protein n=1 Tax=Hahella sp. HNIBRBA332 TaxID=3015983 RepID=UPI00273B8C66|nr:hypothetical protein [Hahella sp. HNIBRBA332]WLQ16244.1 hypothetical protein O5O45_09985 [Hahella sp. HNIBRBA332]
MSVNMDAGIDDLVLRKLAVEAFGMLLEGSVDDARKVLATVNRFKPDNPASTLGLALAERLQAPWRDNGYGGGQNSDPVLCCFQGLIWLQQGREEEARALLAKTSQSQDVIAAGLAQDIIQFEIEGR